MSAGRLMIQQLIYTPLPTAQPAGRMRAPHSGIGSKRLEFDGHSCPRLVCRPAVGDEDLSYSTEDGDYRSHELVSAAIISGRATASTPVACGQYQAGSLDAQAEIPCVRQEVSNGAVAGSCCIAIHKHDIIHWFLEQDCFKGLCAQALLPNRVMLQSRESSETSSAMNAAIGRLQGATGIHCTKEELSGSYFEHWAEAYCRDGPYAPGQRPFERARILNCDFDMSEAARRSKL